MNVIIADSSAVVRTILEQKLSRYEEIHINASVSSCRKIPALLVSQKPDAIICGTDTNDANEKEALNKICKEEKLPVVFLGADKNELNTQFILKNTAFLLKPNLKSYNAVFFEELKNKLNVLCEKQKKPVEEKIQKEEIKAGYRLLCIGASTGGPSAVAEVLCGLGNNFPLPVLYTQHIDTGKDKDLVVWLNGVCRNIFVKLADDGEKAKPGVVYMAPADRHLVINRLSDDGFPVLNLSVDEPEHYLRPAVNKMFKSAAEKYKNNVIAILLTGMGSDGASGCKAICEKGGWTIVEDKSTCAVFGMPAAAIECGGAKEILPRQDIAKRILLLAGNK